MAFWSQFGQKLRVVRGIKGYHSMAGGTCVIKGRYQDIFYPDWMLESLSDHASHSPLVSRVRGRLIKVNPNKPLKINNRWRKILFSALVHSCLCKDTGDCIHNAFNLNNVGVIRGTNIIGFRNFERVWGMRNENHNSYVTFVEELFSKICYPGALQKVHDVDYFLHQLFNGTLPDDRMLANPVFLDDEEIASFYVDVHRLVRHQFPVRGDGDASWNILLDMEDYWANDLCVESCGETFFKFLLGSHEKTAESQKKVNDPLPGSAVIDIPRIIVSHSIERDLLKRARKESVGFKGVLYNYDRPEVLEGCRNVFSQYPQEVLSSFEDNGVWPALRMKERLPVPEIYGYVSPGYVPPGYVYASPGYGYASPGYGYVSPGYVPPGYGYVSPGYVSPQ